MKLFLPLSSILSYLLFAAEGSSTYNEHHKAKQPVQSSPRAHELTSLYSFDQYIVDFQKVYHPDSNDYVVKKQVFEKNLQTILKHNENVMYDLETGQPNENSNGHSFHMGVNHLLDLTEDEVQSKFFGYDKSLHKAYASSSPSGTTSTATSRREMRNLATNYEMALPFNITDVSTLPASFRYDNRTPIKNQGGCGSCWAFASIEALEVHLAIQTGTLDVLSPQELVSCVDNPSKCGGSGGCSGATAELAYEYIATHGVLKEDSFAYTGNDEISCPLDSAEVNDGTTLTEHSFTTMLRHKKVKTKMKNQVIESKNDAVIAKVGGYAKIPTNSYKGLMNAVAKHSPVVIAAAASPWMFYEGGVFSPEASSDEYNLNHGIVVEGYGSDETTGEDYWLVRNSWGSGWGEDGYIRLRRVDPEASADPDSDCGFDTNPLDGVACQLNPDGSAASSEEVKVCGTNGMLFDPIIPVGGYSISSSKAN